MQKENTKSTVVIDLTKTQGNNGKIDIRFNIGITHKSEIVETTVLTEEQFKDLVIAVYELCPPKITDLSIERPTGEKQKFSHNSFENIDIEREIPDFILQLIKNAKK